MSILKEFKQFAMKGNAMELAVAFIMGGAFGKIVSSLVADVIMPPLGLVVGGVNFSHLKLTLKSAIPQKLEQGRVVQEAVAEVSLNYGIFLQNVLDFIIIAFAMFLAVKAINTVKAKIAEEEKKEAERSEPSEEVQLLQQIRDALLKDSQKKAD
ncbi:MAG: large-conductance mechanosensitive channel protein MscL [Flavobacteriales bacterium]